MASRPSVTFAPSFGSEDEGEQDFQYDFHNVAAHQQQHMGPDHNDPRAAAMQTTGMGGGGRPNLLGAYALNSGIVGASSRNLNSAIGADDGRSLVGALGQSIRHHARMIDGDQLLPAESTAAKKAALAAYDPYQDDDHVSLAPAVELNYEKEAREVKQHDGGSAALRAFAANASVQGANENSTGGSGRIHGAGQSSVAPLAETTSSRFSLSNWFTNSFSNLSDRGAKARFSETEEDEVVAVIRDGGTGLKGGGSKLFVPPPTYFRTATRHPSRLPAEFSTVEDRINAPKRILAARKRHRRNDSFFRLVVLVLCFALSLTFAVYLGSGKFGLAITSLAYERKAARLKDIEITQQAMEEVFYPEWWEDEKGIPDMASRNVEFMPTVEYNAADVDTPRAPGRIETPFFWLVPRSGANAVRTVMWRCLRLAEASEAGAGEELNVLKIVDGEDKRYVNVDLSTSKGLAHAKELNLASSGVPDVIISGDMHGTLELFNNLNRARVFAVFRNPIERAISKYYADLASDPDVAGMTLTQYVRQGGHRVQNNYLTRHLSGRYGGKLEVFHLDVAREFLRRKFVVGLARDLPATTNLFTHVYGWNNTAAIMGMDNAEQCYQTIFNALTDSSPPSVDEGSEGWKLLVSQNWFDLKLYEYAEYLFQQQIDQLKKKGSLKLKATA
mmetsp:Transcript_31688/g.64029  ORF Transcript_31688/g.64029 Transcript_31688/m.64029 type:complete len:672 (+) Transcript_31688:87-2102(+)